MKKIDVSSLNFEKLNGLIPAVIQDSITAVVLMVGFMSKESLKLTLKKKRVVFFSRTKNRLWEKGESSGNYLELVDVLLDCDNDSLLIKVKPNGPVCHTGDFSCFKDDEIENLNFLVELSRLLLSRKKTLPKGSYTTSLFREGKKQILAKIKEESGEVIQAAEKETKKRLIEESADLIFHLMVLLTFKGLSIVDVVGELTARSRNKKTSKEKTNKKV